MIRLLYLRLGQDLHPELLVSVRMSYVPDPLKDRQCHVKSSLFFIFLRDLTTNEVSHHILNHFSFIP